LGAVACLVPVSCSPAPEVAPERVVLITIDTLRADRFGAEPMPLTWGYAQRGTVHTQAYAATSSTQPTHATLFTGLHPWEHGVTRNGLPLEAAHSTVAEHLKAAGFETRAVVASFPLARVFGFDQGFDQYVEEFQRPLQGRTEWQGTEVEGRRFYSLAQAVTDRALAQLDAAAPGRQFFWFHYFDPHSPYGDSSGPGLRGAQDSDAELVARAYDADVASLDGELARLLARIDRDADSIPTHVVLTADHGESLGEGGVIGHETRVTPEQVRVPLFVRSPRVDPGRSDTPVGSADVFRMLLALAGIEPDEPASTDEPAGVQVVGMRRSFEDPSEPGRAPRFFAVVDGRLIAGNAVGVASNAPPFDELEGTLAEELRRLFASFEEETARTRAPLLEDERVREGLGALGYTE